MTVLELVEEAANKGAYPELNSFRPFLPRTLP